MAGIDPNKCSSDTRHRNISIVGNMLAPKLLGYRKGASPSMGSEKPETDIRASVNAI